MSQTLHERAERARKAQSLLDNPLLDEAFRLVRESCIEQMIDGKTVEEREDAHRSLKMLDHVKNALHKFVRDGVKANHKLKELEQRGDAA